MRAPLAVAASLSLFALLLLFIALPASASQDAGPTILSGVINTPTTLDNPDGYLVQGKLVVSDLLTINPGVTLTFTAGSSLYVAPDGALKAVAESYRSIRFVGMYGVGSWSGITIEGEALMRGLEISGAKVGITLATVDLLDTAVVTLVSSFIENNETGLAMVPEVNAKALDDIHILNNSGYAIEYKIPSPSSWPEQIFYPTFTNLHVQDNGTDAVKVDQTFQANATCKTNCYFRLASPRLHDGGVLPLHMDFSYVVKSDHELELPAGAEIAGRGITVQQNGRLTVNGSLAEPMKLTQHPIYGFTGIVLEPDSYANITFCDVSGSSLSYPAFRIESSKVTLADCRIHDGGSDGVRLNGAGINPILQRLKIENNAGYAISQSSLNMQPRYADLEFNGNGIDAIGVGDGTVTGNIDIFPPEGVDGALPFILAGSTAVGEGGTLTLHEGTTLLATNAANRILVADKGTLIADGVTFSRTVDLTEPWRGILFQTGATGELSDCMIIGAGIDFVQSGALEIESSDVSVDGCRISGSLSNGVVLRGEGIAPPSAI